MSGRLQRELLRRWLWRNSARDRGRSCGRHVLGHGGVAIVKRGGRASYAGLETCGSVWACPVCSERVLAKRGIELTEALDAWHAQGGQVAMVTLTMRHGRADALADQWEALSDAWAAATGRSSGARRAKRDAGVEGWVRRVEATWGESHGWHVHVHALLFLSGDVAGLPGANDRAQALGAAMFSAWEARLRRVGLTPIRDQGGLDVRLLSLEAAREDVASYVAKQAFETTSRRAALEIAGGGKLGRGGNVSPWGILAAAESGDRQAAALWHEWEAASLGRRAITWSQGFRDRLGLGEEREDDDLAADVDEPPAVTIAVWSRDDWPALRDGTAGTIRGAQLAVQLLAVAESEDDPWAAFDAIDQWAQIARVPRPRPGPDLEEP